MGICNNSVWGIAKSIEQMRNRIAPIVRNKVSTAILQAKGIKNHVQGNPAKRASQGLIKSQTKKVIN
jgi:hypothetical protein